MSVSRASFLLRGVSVAIVLIGALTWLGGIVYWDVKIRTAMSELEIDPHDSRATFFLTLAGSRALPHFVAAIEVAKTQSDRDQLILWSYWLAIQVNELEPRARVGSQGHPDPRIPRVFSEDSADVVRSKCHTIRDWWNRESGRYPPKWRFWESRGPV